jgi:wyosine [tRNA(Phe)-imidazoG37] synthetase (radical SAM superfamily)
MVIVSLGSNCAVAYHLQELGLRTNAYPFDWVKISINSLNKVLENNFDGYSNIFLKKLSTNHPDFSSGKPTYLIKNNYNITMAHEITNIEDFKLNTWIDILHRRIERFTQLKNPTFVRIETSNLSEKQMESYNKLVELLDKYFNKYHLIVISKIKPSNYKIKWYELESFDENWKYENINWKQLFYNILI